MSTLPVNDAAVNPAERVAAFEAEQARAEGAHLAAEARQREADAERVRRVAADEVRWAVDLARDVLPGPPTNTTTRLAGEPLRYSDGACTDARAVAVLTAAILARRYLDA